MSVFFHENKRKKSVGLLQSTYMQLSRCCVRNCDEYGECVPHPWPLGRKLVQWNLEARFSLVNIQRIELIEYTPEGTHCHMDIC